MTRPKLWRYAAAAFWIAAGANHFRHPRFYEQIVPPPLDRWKNKVNVLAGTAELGVAWRCCRAVRAPLRAGG